MKRVRRGERVSRIDQSALARELVPRVPPKRIRASPRKRALDILIILPGMGSLFVLFLPGSSLRVRLFSAVFALGLTGATIARSVLGRSRGERAEYLDYLRELTESSSPDAELDALVETHPAPSELLDVVSRDERRVWERRPDHGDFALARIGTATRPSSAASWFRRPVFPPRTELDPRCVKALNALLAARVRDVVDDAPVALSLGRIRRLVVGGAVEPSLGLVRAMLAQLAAFHSPADLVIAVAAADGRLDRWSWIKWLPHAQHPTRTDAAGSVRLITRDPGDLRDLLSDWIPRISAPGESAAVGTDGPHVLVILDGVSKPASPSAGWAHDIAGVTFLEVLPAAVLQSERCTLMVDQEIVCIAEKQRPDVKARPDYLGLDAAKELARRLARFRPAVTADFSELTGIGDAGSFDPQRSWKRLSPQDRLRVPIGVGEDGEPVILDIRETGMGGTGPHGLCIGATGSGKSELLRTLVLALAVRHSSETLNFVLCDFKGGATFAGMAQMPHTAAVITNLADDLTMVDRMRDAIVGELNRRQELLRDGGNIRNIHDYEKARAAGAALTPLPNLLVIVDEFAEMLTAKPEFLDLFIQIGRIGRSLGVHLLLASQRLEEGRLRGLETHLSYRLGLKTFTPAESTAVLGVPDAFNLPSVPGSGYLKTVSRGGGHPAGTRFTTTYVSGPYHPRRRFEPTEFAAEYRNEPVTEAEAVDIVLDVLVRRMKEQGPPAHEVWLPPLTAPPTLDRLMPDAIVWAPGRTVSAERPRGRGLTVPIGIVDSPLTQQRYPYELDLSAAGGHVAVVGGLRTGKSTVALTILTALALGHTPAEAQFFCLDFGGGALAALSGLPHLSGYAGRLDHDMARRIVDVVAAVVDKRGRGEPLDGRFGDVFLVVDGWQTLRSELEQLEAGVRDIVQRGLPLGVHVIITVAHRGELGNALQNQDAFGSWIELRLADPMGSKIDKAVARSVPAGTPGRGLTMGKLHFLGALPRIDGVEDAADLADGVAKTVSAIANAWQGPPAPRVRTLPLMVDYRRDLPPAAQRPGRLLPLGLAEARLEPVYLDFTADPHFLMFGEGGSGKTSVLRTLVQGITEAYTPAQARIIAVDYGRGLLGAIPESHELAYCAAAPVVQNTVAQLQEVLEKRQPGPDVTQEQLRTRSWWTGLEVFVIVDDYDLVATRGGNPLTPLEQFLPMARDLGFHLIVARDSGGAGRALFDPLIQCLRESRQPGLMLSGAREEGQLIGQVRPSRLPPGRGTLVSRRHGTILVQTAYLPPPE